MSTSKTNRKEFLLQSLGLASFLGLAAKAEAKGSKNKPLVISTWNFGQAANAAAWEKLSSGASALDAVEAGVRVPEGDPKISSVGLGGWPDRDGRVTLDACIMDHQGNCGSVTCLEHIVHPISVARAVMEKTPHVLLTGEGALEFALSQGFTKENLLTPEAEAAWKKWLETSKYEPVINIENHDTIGMLALDKQGNLGGACTTSGLAWKMHGRVGDSPIIGAGLFVDNEVGAATATGVGEEVIRIAGSHTIVELMRQGKHPQKACEIAVRRIVHKRGEAVRNVQVAFLAVDRKGRHGAFALNKGFTYALRTGSVNDNIASDYYFH